MYERYPALRQLARVRLCELPPPVEKAHVQGVGDIWIKRDDLNAPVCGGNKARSLEFLLGGLEPGQSVVTLGGAGSTHVLATAVHCERIGVAGLLLGLRIAGLDIEVVGARVGPRIFVNRLTVLRLVRRTAALISSITGERLPRVDPMSLRVEHRMYGGAYGRPLASASEAAANLQLSSGIRLDDTYSAKAWVAAIEESRRSKGPVLFWLTFDSRWLTN